MMENNKQLYLCAEPPNCVTTASILKTTASQGNQHSYIGITKLLPPNNGITQTTRSNEQPHPYAGPPNMAITGMVSCNPVSLPSDNAMTQTNETTQSNKQHCHYARPLKIATTSMIHCNPASLPSGNAMACKHETAQSIKQQHLYAAPPNYATTGTFSCNPASQLPSNNATTQANTNTATTIQNNEHVTFFLHSQTLAQPVQ